MDADGRRVALYAQTPEELYEKVREAQRQIEEAVFRKTTPTVAEYCARWLIMQSGKVRATTLADYTSKVKNYIVAPLGRMRMADVTSDDITNLLYSGADPKTVQYLAGHKNSKITMDTYAKVKYNRPEQLLPVVDRAFSSEKGSENTTQTLE